MISRGDIRWFRFDSPDKRRPVLLLGRAELVASWSMVPVIPLSSVERGLAWEVRLGEADGLPQPCVLKPEWIRSVDRMRIGPLVARLADSRWNEIERALLAALGFAESRRE